LFMFLTVLLFMLQSAQAQSCYFPLHLTSNDTDEGVFGAELEAAANPCIIKFTTQYAGALRLDFNNKMFALKKDKKSCLSEYILVKFGGQTQKLCHSNVTTPIRVGDTEEAGHFDSYTPVTILVKWMGVLDIRTSYLGRFHFNRLNSPLNGFNQGDDYKQMETAILKKLHVFLKQKGQEERLNNLKEGEYKFLTQEDCEMQKKISCKQSRFCAEKVGGTECNRSVLMCIPSEKGCDGNLDCLEGDHSDELGCYMPYVLISTGGVVLALTVLGSGACLLQHHNMMVKNGMTSYKQDLVRRKDKVKARKADTKPPAIKLNTSSSVNSADTPVKKATPIKQLAISAFDEKVEEEKQALIPKQVSTNSAVVADSNKNQVKKTMIGPLNGALKVENVKDNTTDGKVPNGRKMSQTKDTPDAHMMMGGHKDLSRSTETLEESRSYENRAVNRKISMSSRDNKILADERDIKKELHQMEAFAENYGQNSVDMVMGNGGRNTRDENMKIFSRQRSVQAQTPSHQQFEINRSGSVDTEIEDSTKECWRVRRHTGDSTLADLDISKGGYGYRFDFRSSGDFEFTGDAYI